MKVLTIFERLEPFHINKDVVQLPEKIASISDGECYVVYNTDNNMGDTSVVKYKKLGGASIGLLSFKIVMWLLKKSKKFNLLFLIHLRYYNLIYLLVYKIINKKGEVYVKLDQNEIKMMEEGVFFGNPIKKYFERKLFDLLKKHIVVISAETDFAVQEASRQLQVDNIVKVPNCIDSALRKEINKGFSKRKRKILFIGRLSAAEKNVDFFLDVLKGIDLKEWCVEFIGDYEDDIKLKLKQLIEVNVLLTEKLILTGPVWNRKELISKMKESRVFCLSSLYEGSPLVFSESVSAGLIICTTEVSAAEEYAGEFGYISRQGNCQEYQNNLRKIINMTDDQLDELHLKICEKYKDLTWETYAIKLIDIFNLKN